MVHVAVSSVWLLFSLFSSLPLCFSRPGKVPSSKEGLESSKVSQSGGKTQDFDASSNCASRWPKPKGTVMLSGPKSINTKFDCDNQIYQNKGGPVFVLTEGASLSNCFFQQSGSLDTVHVFGNGTFTMTNLYFLNTGDDGVAVKGPGNVHFIGGGFLRAGNKAFQHDGSGRISLKGGCFDNVHILLKSCGNCKVNDKVKGRTLQADDISIFKVRTVCGVNTNKDDMCTLTNIKGKPIESHCTGYEAITDPKHWPQQTSKNLNNAHCSF